MRRDQAVASGKEILATYRGSASAGVNPRVMGIGPVPATEKLLKKLNLGVNDLDLIELNEAFAAQSLAVIRTLGLDETKVNVNGGAIALGHPLGCSGARILTTLIYALRKRGGGRGLATLCVGVGQGVATCIEV
jgi:acetyl-CoA acetyltransferase